MKIIRDESSIRLNFFKPNYLRIFVIILSIHLCHGLDPGSASNENPSFSTLADFHGHLARARASNLGRPSVNFDPLGRRLTEDNQISVRPKAKFIDGLQGARLLDKLRRSRSRSAYQNVGEIPQKQGNRWKKRQTETEKTSANTVFLKDPNKYAERQQRWQEEDKFLDSLKPRKDCAEKLDECAKNMPLRYIECLVDCYVALAVLESNQTKYIYRLTSVFNTYAQMLCPVFGNIYQKFIGATGADRSIDASVQGFLAGLGIEYGTADFAVFMKNAADSIFYYLIMYGAGIYDELKSMLQAAGEALRVETKQALMSPDFLDGQSSVCKQLPKPTWYLPIIDFVTKHPVYTDLLLRGYYLIFRALTQNLPTPTEGMFYALAKVFQLMTGTPCGIIAFAEIANPYGCVPKPPLEDISEYYAKETMQRERPADWIVCGAHQVQTQEYIDAQNQLQSRRTPLDEEQLKGKSLDFTLDNVPNPEEPGINDYSEVVETS